MKQSLLILSFSDIAQDARVRKQVNLFAGHYDVTTCGFGPQVREDVPHIEIPARTPRTFKYLEAIALRLRLYGGAYKKHPRVRAALQQLRGSTFDAILANDLDTLGVAHEICSGQRIHADLHEYFPGLGDQDPRWVKLRKPFNDWALRRFAGAVASVTTVSETIATRYQEEFGIECGVVHNAPPYAELHATEVSRPIRIVHSGGAQANRRIEVMMEAVAQSQVDVSLDLYLTGVGTSYHDSLLGLAERLGGRVTIHPPVQQRDLIRVLNQYDVGIHVLPPTNTNNRLALPNKFFDYVQARLALLIGPTPDMQSLLNEYDLGVVTRGYDVAATRVAIERLHPTNVRAWKANAEIAAPANCAEAQEENWLRPVAKLLGPSSEARG